MSRRYNNSSICRKLPSFLSRGRMGHLLSSTQATRRDQTAQKGNMLMLLKLNVCSNYRMVRAGIFAENRNSSSACRTHCCHRSFSRQLPTCRCKCGWCIPRNIKGEYHKGTGVSKKRRALKVYQKLPSFPSCGRMGHLLSSTQATRRDQTAQKGNMLMLLKLNVCSNYRMVRAGIFAENRNSSSACRTHCCHRSFSRQLPTCRCKIPDGESDVASEVR